MYPTKAMIEFAKKSEEVHLNQRYVSQEEFIMQFQRLNPSHIPKTDINLIVPTPDRQRKKDDDENK